MLEAVRTSETSVSIYQTTRHNITEDRDLNTDHSENLKSHRAPLSFRLFAVSSSTLKQGSNREVNYNIYYNNYHSVDYICSPLVELMCSFSVIINVIKYIF
jgi:hypothetical protein